MNVKELKLELKEGGLRTTGWKAELAARLVLLFQEGKEDEYEGVIDDNDTEGEIEGMEIYNT